MKMMFYDVKTRQKVESEVTEKLTYDVNGQTRYAVKAKTSDGRNLTRFVSKADFDSVQI
jgi:copper(I)-binding protein